MPEAVAETLAALLEHDDEEAHEAELTLVGGDGSAADQPTFDLRGDEGFGVRGPEQIGIIAARVPTLACGPADERVHFRTGHVSYQKLIGHRGPRQGDPASLDLRTTASRAHQAQRPHGALRSD